MPSLDQLRSYFFRELQQYERVSIVVDALDESKDEDRGLLDHVNGRGDLRNDIINGVIGKAKGIFLLACLHVDSLAKATNRRHLRNALAELPDTIADAYIEALRRIDSQGKHRKELAYRVLSWIAFAKRPLMVLELQHSFAGERGVQDLDVENITESDDFMFSLCWACNHRACNPH